MEEPNILWERKVIFQHLLSFSLFLGICIQSAFLSGKHFMLIKGNQMKRHNSAFSYNDIHCQVQNNPLHNFDFNQNTVSVCSIPKGLQRSTLDNAAYLWMKLLLCSCVTIWAIISTLTICWLSPFITMLNMRTRS